MNRCHRCGHPYDGPSRVGFDATCPECLSHWRACANCALYNPSRSNRCESRTTESVRDPEGKSFCDEFVFADTPGGAPPPGARGAQAQQAREAFDRLFGDAPNDESG